MISDAYLAGVFDGEGYIAVSKIPSRKYGGVGYQVVVRVSMINKVVVASFQQRFGGSLLPLSKRADRARGVKSRDQWQWKANGSKVPFLQAVVPHLIEKHDQAVLALQYIEEFGEGSFTRIRKTPEQKARQAWYCDEFKRLKKVCGWCDEEAA